MISGLGFKPDKQELPQRTSKLAKEKGKMTHTKQVQRKSVQGMARVTNASTTVQSLPLPKGIKEEGELLYRQYFPQEGQSLRFILYLILATPMHIRLKTQM